MASEDFERNAHTPANHHYSTPLPEPNEPTPEYRILLDDGEALLLNAILQLAKQLSSLLQ
jgi:hypothetical protein